jgi:hypothetical protein
MKEFKFFMNEYMFLANFLLFLCYMQKNLLMFRLLFISACLFFLIFSLTLPVISIDTVLFNITFVLINIMFSVPLIKNLIPPKFTKEQKEIFRNHFKNYLSPVELNLLLSHHRRRILKVSTTVIKSGNEFSSLFFIAKIGKNCRVELKSKRRNFDLVEYSWVGMPEYLNLISKKESLNQALRDSDTGEWNVSIHIEVNQETDFCLEHEDCENEIRVQTNTNVNNSRDTYNLKDEDNMVILYEFELNHMNQIFSHGTHGGTIMRGLHSIWLKYCTDIVKKVDQSIAIGNNTSVSMLKKSNTMLEENELNKAHKTRRSFNGEKYMFQ